MEHAIEKLDNNFITTSLVSFFGAGYEERYEQGQLMADIRKPIDKVFCLTDGFAKVVSHTPLGAEKAQFILGPGDVFPLHNLFQYITRKEYPVYLYSLTDTVSKVRSR